MDLDSLTASASIVISAPPEELYDFIADMPRIGEISPVCTGGEWEGANRGVGATFIGSNTMGERTWQARMRVVAADAPREFAWENIGDPAKAIDDDTVPAARWTWTFAPVDSGTRDGGTRVEESWKMLLVGPQLEAIGEERLKAVPAWNQSGIEATLAKLKVHFEG